MPEIGEGYAKPSNWRNMMGRWESKETFQLQNLITGSFALWG